jgi:hypothetical protein
MVTGFQVTTVLTCANGVLIWKHWPLYAEGMRNVSIGERQCSLCHLARWNLQFSLVKCLFVLYLFDCVDMLLVTQQILYTEPPNNQMFGDFMSFTVHIRYKLE